MLRTADEWRFDAFALEAASDGRPLSMLAFYLLKRSGLVQSMSLDEAKLAAFLLRIEDGYPNNPYHNRTHAADVLQSMHVLLVHGGLREGCACADYALLAAYMAAVSGGGRAAERLAACSSSACLLRPSRLLACSCR